SRCGRPLGRATGALAEYTGRGRENRGSGSDGGPAPPVARGAPARFRSAARGSLRQPPPALPRGRRAHPRNAWWAGYKVFGKQKSEIYLTE
nr:hypothetical protein [Tanacetum cinerariifolium]